MLDAAYVQLKRQSRRNLVSAGTALRPATSGLSSGSGTCACPTATRRVWIYTGTHPFTTRHPNLGRRPLKYGFADFSDLDWFNRVVDRNLAGRHAKRHLRLFLGEFTVPTAPRDLEFFYWVTPKTQARWIKSGFKVARQVGAYTFGWVHLRDDPSRADGYPVRNSGLIYNDGRKKPGYYAFRRG